MDQKIVDQVMAKIRPALEGALEEVLSQSSTPPTPGTAAPNLTLAGESPLVTPVGDKPAPAKEEVPPLGGLAAAAKPDTTSGSGI